MPGIEGNLITFSGDASFDMGWFDADAELRGSVTPSLTAGACHGVEIGAGILAEAQASAAASAVLLGLKGHVEAFASAEAGLALKLSPNLFEQAGLCVEAQASAQAAVAGRIQIEVLLEDMVEHLMSQVSSTETHLVLAFLREVEAHAGLWGSAAFAAMAAAKLEVTLDLQKEKDSGLKITGGFAAGWGGGTAWDWFCGVDLKSPRRFLSTAADLLTRDVITGLKSSLPSSQHAQLQALDLWLPIALASAYDLGQTASLGTLGSKAAVRAPFGEACLEGIQRYLLDRTSNALVKAVEASAADLGLSPSALEDLRELLESAIDRQNDGNQLAEAFDAIHGLLQDSSTTSPDDGIDEQLAQLWTALVSGLAIRSGSAEGAPLSAGTQASFLGMAASARVIVRPMPTLVPGFVLEQYRTKLGYDTGYSIVSIQEAIEFLSRTEFDPIVRQYEPDAEQSLDRLKEISEEVGLVDTDDWFAAALRGNYGSASPGASAPGSNSGNGATNSALGIDTAWVFEKLAEFAEGEIREHLLDDLLPSIIGNATLPDEPWARYTKEVAQPALRALVDFVFGRMAYLTQDGIADYDSNHEGWDANEVFGGVSDFLENSPFLSELSAGMSAVAWKLFSRSVAFFASEFVLIAQKQMPTGLENLAVQVENGDAESMIDAAIEHLPPWLAPPGGLGSESQRAAVTDAVAALLRIGKRCFGPEVFTDERVARSRALLGDILDSLDGDVDWNAPSDSLTDKLSELASCAFIPNPSKSLEFAGLQGEMLFAQLGITLVEGKPVVLELGQRLLLPPIEAGQQIANDVIVGLHQAWQGFATQAGVLANQVTALAQSILSDLQSIVDPFGVLNNLIGGVLPSLQLPPQHVFADAQAATNRSDFFARVEARVGEILRPFVGILGFHPVDENSDGVQDGEDVLIARAQLVVTSIRPILQGVWAQESRRREAVAALIGKEADEAEAQLHYDVAIGLGSPYADIVQPSPMPTNPEDVVRHGRFVDVSLAVKGVRESQMHDPNVVRVLVNEVVLSTQALLWVGSEFDGFAATLRLDLEKAGHHLNLGLNRLDLIVADPGDEHGPGPIMHDQVIFFVETESEEAESITVVGEHDPGRLAIEVFVLETASRHPIDIGGYRLQRRDGAVVARFRRGTTVSADRPLSIFVGRAPLRRQRNLIELGRDAALTPFRGDALVLADTRGRAVAHYLRRSGPARTRLVPIGTRGTITPRGPVQRSPGGRTNQIIPTPPPTPVPPRGTGRITPVRGGGRVGGRLG